MAVSGIRSLRLLELCLLMYVKVKHFSQAPAPKPFSESKRHRAPHSVTEFQSQLGYQILRFKSSQRSQLLNLDNVWPCHLRNAALKPLNATLNLCTWPLEIEPMQMRGTAPRQPFYNEKV